MTGETGVSETEKAKSGLGKNLSIGCVGLVGLVAVLLAIGGTNEGSDKGSGTPADPGMSAPAVADVVDPKPLGMTTPQANAARSAKQYLQMSGFSRDGLISQLSSDAGDRYAVADATVAVDSLDVDWNEQAARSAAQYLKMSGFSCQGLIDQLSSSAGDKYTVDQATHGAKQAGAC